MIASRWLLQATTILFLPFASCEESAPEITTDKYRTNYGPLTTTFTPDPTCLAETTTRYPWRGAYPDLEIGCGAPGYGSGLESANKDCCPEGVGRYRYFSPGVCPSGYAVCTLPTTRQRDETTNLCCPSDFDCPTQVDNVDCKSSLNTWETAEYTDEDGSTSLATFMEVWATPIQIRFRQTDSDVVPIPTDSLRLPPPLTQEELDAQKGGLSTAAKIGIGVGVGVGVILIVIALVWYVRKVARKLREESDQQGFMLVDSLQEEPTGEEPQPSKQTFGKEQEAPPAYSKH
jgi:hypothetical protein